MTNDKIKEAAESALSELESISFDTGVTRPINKAKEVLKKALKPEVKFFKGQQVLVTNQDSEVGTEATYLYLCVDGTHHVICSGRTGTSYFKKCYPNPNAPVPPGYIKIHKHDGSSEAPDIVKGKSRVVAEDDDGVFMFYNAKFEWNWGGVQRYAIWPESEGE